MPGFDGTGPRGNAPLTGRGLGSCNRNRMCKQGRGFGRGLGQCFRSPLTQTEENKTEQLKTLRESLNEELRWVDNELAKNKKE